MVKSALRVCQLLTLISKNKGGLRNAEIAKALSMPTSSTSKLLATLVDQKFVSLDSETLRYSVGHQLLSLAGSYLDGLDLTQYSRPVVEKLAEDTGESVAVLIRTSQKVMVIFKIDSNQPIKPSMQIGQRSPMYASASGKVILAFLPENELERYFSSVKFNPITKKTITDPKILRRQLEKIRSTGLAYNREELEDQIIAIAAPIFDLFEIVVASLLVYVPTVRFTKKKRKQIECCLPCVSPKKRENRLSVASKRPQKNCQTNMALRDSCQMSGHSGSMGSRLGEINSFCFSIAGGKKASGLQSNL